MTYIFKNFLLKTDFCSNKPICLGNQHTVFVAGWVTTICHVESDVYTYPCLTLLLQNAIVKNIICMGLLNKMYMNLSDFNV